jgi:XapX domain-containing protein
MKPYLVSLAVGILVGIFYNVVEVKSPAPPTVALAGLLGMLAGEHALAFASTVVTHFVG